MFNFLRHVQINNEGAIEFYKKFGFEIVETKEHYYKRIEPADAHVLQKSLKKSNSSTSNLTSTTHSQNIIQVNGHDKNVSSCNNHVHHGKSKA